MKGGNTDEFYEKEGTLNKSQMLVDMHPDVTRLIERWNRWHHYVDYYRYKQKPILKSGLNIPKGNNEYGLVLKEFT